MRTYTQEEVERLAQDEDKFWEDEFKFLEIPPEHIKDFLETPIEVDAWTGLAVFIDRLQRELFAGRESGKPD